MSTDVKPDKRVLIAEDNPVSRRSVERLLLKWGYAVAAVNDGTEALHVLESENAPRLAILDWMMPGTEGAQICRHIRERTNRPYVYMLLLTARSNKRDLLRGLELGADDYLTKPFDAEELRARLLVGERVLNLQDDLLSAQEELRFRATHDSLTGIPNRAMALEALDAELNRQKRSGDRFGVVLLDIDNFKSINDTHGHLCGDEVLQTVAERLRRCVRPYDTVGRYGGEEFLVVASSSDVAGTMALAERIRSVISSSGISTKSGEVRVTVSMGVAVGNQGEHVNPERLLKGADEALYRAKHLGRNRVELAHSLELASERLDRVRE